MDKLCVRARIVDDYGSGEDVKFMREVPDGHAFEYNTQALKRLILSIFPTAKDVYQIYEVSVNCTNWENYV